VAKEFAYNGVAAGKTTGSRRERALQHQKGHKVTMGFGIPRQADGAVGDITVNKISQGLRCYIKTDSGWFDINTMQSAVLTEWRPMILDSSWVRHSTAYSVPSYFRDDRGFVHLRGGLKDGSGADATITTLPVGFRPAHTTLLPAASSDADSTFRPQVKILKTGVVNFAYGGITALSWLDGISFYAAQKVVGQGGGSGGGAGGGASHGGGGA